MAKQRSLGRPSRPPVVRPGHGGDTLPSFIFFRQAVLSDILIGQASDDIIIIIRSLAEWEYYCTGRNATATASRKTVITKALSSKAASGCEQVVALGGGDALLATMMQARNHTTELLNVQRQATQSRRTFWPRW